MTLTSLLLALCVAGEADHVALPDLRPFLGKQPSLDPDEPRFEYAHHQLRWHAMAGSELGLWGIDHPRLRYALALSGFIELVNISPAPVPWHTFRANVGFDTFWRPRGPRPSESDVVIAFGWHHESDHVASQSGFRGQFLAPGGDVNTGNFSAFEYFKLRADWVQGFAWAGAPALRTIVAPGIRVFTPSINDGDLRAPTVGLQSELRLDVRVARQTTVWFGAFGEWVHNRFVASRHGVISDPGERDPITGPRPFLTRSLRVGATLTNRSRTMQFVPQVGYEHSNGRGVDFMRRWGHAVVMAVTIYR